MTFLTRYRPYRSPLSALPRELDRLMDEALGTMEWGRGENLRNWFPVTDVSETPEHLSLRLEVPGLSRDQIKISVEDNMLTVRGEKKQETTREDETFYRTERSYGSFERSFSLPTHFDKDAIHASLEDGVLTIRVPRREEAKAREISIEGSGERKEIEA
ncbi:MAG: Hsp20/alpha crystallin family protein [Gemmatimonadetes bacterium]|nr:Hsp20/alpha crystallin family protein [Gemmatimonadota bacterium]